MPDRRTGTKQRFAKAHSRLIAADLQRLGWTLRREFREPGDEEPYEYLFEWAREGAPAYPKPKEPVIPNVTAEEMAAKVRALVPEASIEIRLINPNYSSWELRVKKGKLEIEYVWGPLSGFGGRDLARPATPDDTPFDYADELFNSTDEALEYLRRFTDKYA